MWGQIVKKAKNKPMGFSSCISHHKGRILTACGGFFVMLALWMALPHPVEVQAAETVHATVNNIQQMNEALGGNHKIKGNRLILQSDVTLDTKCDIAIQSTKPFEMTLDMNGKTIRNKSGIFFKTEVPYNVKLRKWTFTVTGSGKLVSDYGMFVDSNGNGRTDLVLAGDVDYHASGFLFSIEGSITMKKGTLHKPQEDKNSANNPTVYIGDFVMQGGKIEGAIEVVYNMEMTGGMVGEIHGDTEGSVPEITIRGGTVKGMVDECRLVMYGGKIGSFRAVFEGGLGLHLYGGTIEKGVTLGDECGITMSGGTIKGKGVDLKGEFSEMKMTGGKIIAEDSIAVKCLYGAKLRFGGGTIAVTKKNAVGIYGDATARVVLLNGTIKQKYNTGKYAIQLTKKNPFDMKGANLYMKGEKGQKIHTTGFKYALKRNAASKVSMSKHTKISCPQNSKKNYTSSSKLPTSIKGNMLVKF